MEKHISESIGDNIRKYRKLNNLTQEAFAEKLNLGTQYYAQLERGERTFTLEKIIQICNVLQINIQDIIVIEPNTTEDNQLLLEEIQMQLNTLSHSQLALVYNFIKEFVPYVK